MVALAADSQRTGQLLLHLVFALALLVVGVAVGLAAGQQGLECARPAEARPAAPSLLSERRKRPPLFERLGH
eukprot:7212694-Alexandrium_andersonii.AAC.1